jgi:glutathionyl-hydroquinone reductase
MGMLVEGRWEDDADNIIKDGAFKRDLSTFDREIPAKILDGLAQSNGRYAIIASKSCPWSHRVMLVRAVKGLASRIALKIAGGPRVQGYAIDRSDFVDAALAQPVDHLHQLYTSSDPDYTGRVTIPVFWDRSKGEILSNDSAKIMRCLDRVPDPQDYTLVPDHMRIDIDTLNGLIHTSLSNAVYRAGLAQKQQAYDEAIDEVFSTLDMLEDRLTSRRYLFGQIITETDWRLFPTLVRFDLVYTTHFRCTRKRLVDYPNLWAYARDLYSWQNVAETAFFQENLEGYYLNDGDHNPHKIVGAMPDIDWDAPHQRGHLGAAQIWTRTDGPKDIEPATFSEI